jgi:FMN reductase
LLQEEQALRSPGEPPLILGIGGTFEPTSSTETALRVALAAAEEAGARTLCFGGSELMALSHYVPTAKLSPEGEALVGAIRIADGLIVASPGYHGSISGLVKNALDYMEETVRDTRVYLDGVPVGLVATAYGEQAGANTLAALRSIVHALRGWPTPFGSTINCTNGPFAGGECRDSDVALQLGLIGQQVVEFVRQRHFGAKVA